LKLLLDRLLTFDVDWIMEQAQSCSLAAPAQARSELNVLQRKSKILKLGGAIV